MKYVDSADDHVYDIDLKKGLQHLDGKEALQYVRFRHDALSDFARTERQRKFLQALAGELQSTSSLIKLPKILSNIDPYIETNMTVTQMLKLANLGYESKAEGLISQQLPPLELLVEDHVDGASVITVDERKLQHYVEELLQSGPAPSDLASGE
jgi:anionic cell wall polymer biosynthesis LytR-Cps2A-Psr (LCP) family protein